MSREESAAPLVLGAGGLLGRVLSRLIEERYPGAMSATRTEIDVTDRFRLAAEVERLRPTVVINCAAYADVDGCEADPERARAVNAGGAENAALAAAATGCRIVHVSTDYVFDGRSRRPYTEEDPTGPLSEYGRSKLEGERRVSAAAPDHLIVRSAWLYGRGGRASFVDAVRRRARAGEALRVVADQVGSPTYADDLAEALVRLLGTDHRGIVHFANAGSCSRYEMARQVLSFTGLDPERVQPIRTEESGRPAVRPGYSVLDSSLYARLTGTAPRPWQDALRACLEGSEGAASAGQGER